MDNIITFDNLMVVLAGALAWALAGWINDRVHDPDQGKQSRYRALVSLGTMVATTVLFYFLRQALRGAPLAEDDFMEMLVLVFAGQKAFYMTTNSLLGVTIPPSPNERDQAVLDAAEKDVL